MSEEGKINYNDILQIIHQPNKFDDKKMGFFEMISMGDDEINQKKVKIFGKTFIENNKDKLKIIYKEKEYDIKEYMNDIDEN